MKILDVLQSRAAVCTDAVTLLAALLRDAEQATLAGKRVREILRQARRTWPLDSSALSRAQGGPVDLGAAEALARSMNNLLGAFERIALLVEVGEARDDEGGAREIVDLLTAIVGELGTALAAIHSHRFEEVPPKAASGLASATWAERVLERSLRDLFHGEKEPAVVLRLNDLYDHLAAAIVHCRRACDDLRTIARGLPARTPSHFRAQPGVALR
jgi:hypothetical protein